MSGNTKHLLAIAALSAISCGLSAPALAATNCVFSTSGTVMSLQGSCSTDATITVPNGNTLDGRNYTITAVDPTGGHFVGPVVKNAGATAHVKNLTIEGALTVDVCDGGADRLRGIMFEGASGTITRNNVLNLHQPESGCQEGNAIEVRNEPFDGTHPDTQSVDIAHNVADAFQKGGIICNGDVDCWIHHNVVGQSALQEHVAANSVQLGFGATGTIEHNHIGGNQWLGASDFLATAILLFAADDPVVSNNNVGGNAEAGIYVDADSATINNNRIFESGDDVTHGGGEHYDIGIGNYFGTNAITNNKIRGYEVPIDGAAIGNNKVIPSPHGT